MSSNNNDNNLVNNIKREYAPLSDHDYGMACENVRNVQQQDDEQVDVVGGAWEEGETLVRASLNLRGKVRKPQPFVPADPKKGKNKRKKSIARRSSDGGTKKAKGNVNTDPQPAFEVDYIFGKRPDKQRKDKVEYRVYWKGYPRSEASWEPEENLRFCNGAIEAYERGQGGSTNMANEEEEERDNAEKKVTKRKTKKGEEAKAKRRSQSIASEMDAGRAHHQQITGNKGGKKESERRNEDRSISVKPTPKPNVKRSLPTMRAPRVQSFVKKELKNPQQELGRESSPSSRYSHTSSSSLQDSLSHNNNRATVLPTNGHYQSTSHSAGRAHSLGARLRAEEIMTVERVIRSDIEDIDLVAELLLMDGSRKRVTKKTVQNMVPELLIEYYERALGLI